MAEKRAKCDVAQERRPGACPPPSSQTVEESFEPDWSRDCEVCGNRPVVAATGLCGPCTFGEAETAGGNW